MSYAFGDNPAPHAIVLHNGFSLHMGYILLMFVQLLLIMIPTCINTSSLTHGTNIHIICALVFMRSLSHLTSCLRLRGYPGRRMNKRKKDLRVTVLLTWFVIYALVATIATTAAISADLPNRPTGILF